MHRESIEHGGWKSQTERGKKKAAWKYFYVREPAHRGILFNLASRARHHGQDGIQGTIFNSKKSLLFGDFFLYRSLFSPIVYVCVEPSLGFSVYISSFTLLLQTDKHRPHTRLRHVKPLVVRIYARICPLAELRRASL